MSQIRKQNQESCYESIEQFEFVDSSISQLLDRGVIGIWNPDWGGPVVIHQDSTGFYLSNEDLIEGLSKLIMV